MALPKRNKILQTWQRMQVNNVLGTDKFLVLPLQSFKFRIWHDRHIEVSLMKEGPYSGGMAETSICSSWEESWWCRCSDLAPEFSAVMTRSKYRVLQQKLGCPMKALLVALPLRAKRRPRACGATRGRRDKAQTAVDARRKGWRRRGRGGVVKRRRRGTQARATRRSYVSTACDPIDPVVQDDHTDPVVQDDHTDPVVRDDFTDPIDPHDPIVQVDHTDPNRSVHLVDFSTSTDAQHVDICDAPRETLAPCSIPSDDHPTAMSSAMTNAQTFLAPHTTNCNLSYENVLYKRPINDITEHYVNPPCSDTISVVSTSSSSVLSDKNSVVFMTQSLNISPSSSETTQHTHSVALSWVSGLNPEIFRIASVPVLSPTIQTNTVPVFSPSPATSFTNIATISPFASPFQKQPEAAHTLMCSPSVHSAGEQLRCLNCGLSKCAGSLLQTPTSAVPPVPNEREGIFSRVPESAECQEDNSSVATTCLGNTRSVGDNDAPSNSKGIMELDGLQCQREEIVPRKEEVEEPLDVETVDSYTTFGESSSTIDLHSHSLEHTTQNLVSEINRPSERYESVPEMHVKIDKAEERTVETEADITIDDFNKHNEVCFDNSESIGHTEISSSYAQPSDETENVEIRSLEDVDIEAVDEEGDTNMWSQANTRGSMQTEMLEDECMDIDLADDTDPMVVPDEWCDSCRRQFAPTNEIISLSKRFRFTKWIGALLGYVGLGTIEEQDSWSPNEMLAVQRMSSSTSTSSDQTHTRFSL